MVRRALIDLLDGHAPFAAMVGAARDGDARFAARTFLHPFVAAGVLGRRPWADVACLVVVPTGEAAESLRGELSHYLPGRRVLDFPARGVWYGPESGVPPRVVGRRVRALAALERADIVVVEAATLMEEVRPGAAAPLAFQVRPADPGELAGVGMAPQLRHQGVIAAPG